MSTDLRDSYIEEYEQKYKKNDEALEWLFEKYRLNSSFHEVLIKVCALNSLYSAGVRIDQMGKLADFITHVDGLDSLLDEGSLQAFHIISNTTEEINNIPVFASKYCHFHNPQLYPIYDHYSRMALVEINRAEKFYDPFDEKNLFDYQNYKIILDTYMKKTGFVEGYKEIDEFLWLYGKKMIEKNKEDGFHI